ncbi:hypothetical protein [Pontibacter ruber]|uniref:Glycosyltransferase RgtA/B/C/D-like domain-containing protein n=1 Tax=Pontibacter ruber TaxID=1343895 RepID=A0ABW5CY55_9BACT|nr:hypothetical protein [Pontibacter ruber]
MLILLFLAIRLPLIFLGIPDTIQELLHMLVGERLADDFAMYREVYDDTAPLSALIYWMIDLLAGRSYLTYRLTAAFLLLLQALFLNITLNRHSVYAGKSYIPALLYLILGSITFEFDMLSPLLIGNTFLILSLPYIITVSREGLSNNRLFAGGFMIGLAALSYLPLALFLIVSSFAVFFFASSTFRSFLLMLCGFAFPYAVFMTYYLYSSSLSYFLELHLFRPWQFHIAFLLPATDLAKIMLLPAMLLALSLMSTASLPQRLVFQVKFQQLMGVWLVMSLALVFTQYEISAGTFIVVLPPLAYYSEYLFSIRKKVWMLNVFFFLLLAGVLLLRYQQPLGLNRFVKIDDSRMLLPEQASTGVSSTTVLVLGNDISYYRQNKPVTPYLNWQLSQRHFGRLQQYQAVYEIYQNFRKESPAVIVDQAGLMPELKYKLPAVFEAYEPTGTPSVYKRTR